MDSKPRRVSVDLPPPAAAEIDRLKAITGLTVADMFRHSITLLRIYVKAKREGKEFRIIDPEHPQDQIRLEMPIPVDTESESPVTA